MVVKIHATSGRLAINAERYFVERDADLFRSHVASTLKLGQLVFGSADTSSDDACTIPLITRPDLAAWVPASVRRHVTDAAEIEFIDELTYSRKQLEAPPYVVEVRTRSPFLGQRLKIEARMTISPVDEASCVHTYEGHVTCSMFGFGALVERMIRDSITQTYKRLPRVIQEWNVARRKAVDASGPDIVLYGRPLGIDAGVTWIHDLVEHVVCGEEPGPRTTMTTTTTTTTTMDPAMSWKLSAQITGNIAVAMERASEAGTLRAGIHRAWIAWIDLIKLAFVVVVVVLLRLRVVRVTPSVALGRHRRRKSWEHFLPVSGHHAKAGSGISDSEELLRRVVRRRTTGE